MTPSPRERLHTRICDLFGIEVPVVQTGMGWVAGARLTAATSAAGAMGILASATMTYDQLVRSIGEVRERTDRPFGVNIRTNQDGVDKIVDLLVREKVAVVSFAQAPSEALIKRLRDGGVKTMPTIAAKRHAEKVAAWGVDACIAQGHEGGGHTGAIPTSLLLPEVTRAVDIPVLGAGGFREGAGLVAALAWGAEGIAMGTRFLLTAESTVPDQVKQRYLAATLTDTAVTKAIDGKPQRVIRTALIDQLEKSGPVGRALLALCNVGKLRTHTPTSRRSLLKEGAAMRKDGGMSVAQMAMAANAPMLTRATMVEGRVEAGILPTGQVAGSIGDLPTVAELVDRIVDDAITVLDRLHERTPHPVTA